VSILYVAFDTCALMAVDEGDDETVLIRTQLLSLLYTGFLSGEINVLFDYEGRITREYSRVLRSNSMGRRLLTVAANHYAISYAAGTVTSRCAAALTGDRFDPADVVFIAVAQRTSGVYVTTEEKHLAPARRRRVQRQCNVGILSLEDLHRKLTGG